MKVECKLDNIAYDFAQKRTKFQFSCYGDITSSLEEYLGKNLNVDLKKAGKRSLSANRISLEFARRIARKVKHAKGRHLQGVCENVWGV